jgi:hypothetical protein
MAHRSAQPPKPRGRPRLVSENEETLLRTMGWAHGFSRHDRTNTVHRLRAIRQFITDARFAWLCSDVAPNGDPQDNRGHLRRSPRHQFIDTSADASRLCRNDRSPAISTQHPARVPRVFCLYPAYILVELRFLRHSRPHSANM